jgi:hypothetical protein
MLGTETHQRLSKAGLPGCPAEQGFSGDALQPTLVPRCGFRVRLKPGVRRAELLHEEAKNNDYVKEYRVGFVRRQKRSIHSQHQSSGGDNDTTDL